MQEWIEGLSLYTVALSIPLYTDWRKTVEMAQQVCAGLTAIAQTGHIHGDLKPSNLMLNTEEGKENQIKIIDLDSILPIEENKMDPRYVPTWSPGYAAPEIVHHFTINSVDHGTLANPTRDIYALGITIYELLASKHPFTDRHGNVSFRSRKPLPDIHLLNEKVPDKLVKIIEKATMIEANERYRDAEEMNSALGELLDSTT